MLKETGNRLLRARLRIGLTRLPELTEPFSNSLLVRMLVTLVSDIHLSHGLSRSLRFFVHWPSTWSGAYFPWQDAEKGRRQNRVRAFARTCYAPLARKRSRKATFQSVSPYVSHFCIRHSALTRLEAKLRSFVHWPSNFARRVFSFRGMLKRAGNRLLRARLGIGLILVSVTGVRRSFDPLLARN